MLVRQQIGSETLVQLQNSESKVLDFSHLTVNPRFPAIVEVSAERVAHSKVTFGQENKQPSQLYS